MTISISSLPQSAGDQAASGAGADAGAARRWTAIVLAGTRPEGDPLAAAFGLASKAAIPVLGVPMINWVCRALLACERIERVLILAQQPEPLHTLAGAPSLTDPRVTIAASRLGIARSVLAVAGTGAAPWPVLVTTADHPLLTPTILTDFIEATGSEDFAVGMVERSFVTAVLPETRRTWLRFADGAFSGANLFALQGERARNALRFWSKVEVDRKKAWKLFLRFGPVLATQAILRRLTAAEAIRRAGMRLGMTARLVALRHGRAAIDVDKLGDHRHVEQILMREANGYAASAPDARPGISIFDLDRTLTHKPTYTALMVYAAARLSPLRLAFVPAVILAMAAYALRLITRKRVKEIEHRLLLGNAVRRRDIDRVCAGFARRLTGAGFVADGIERIAHERAGGRRIVLATAANRFYVEAIAQALGIDRQEIVATGSTWQDDRLTARIAGANCYGAAKRDMLDAHLRARGLRRCDVDVRFFTDSVSDRATLEWSDEPVAVNPSKGLHRLAVSRGWPVLEWR